MWNRVFRNISAVATILLLTGVPTQASPVIVSEVVQVLSNYQSAPDLSLRNLPVNSGQRESSRVSQNGSFDVADWALNPTPDSLLTGMAVGSDPQKVEVIAQGDVEGTVCDCGEILVAGGFPKWPLLFLAGIPFIFIRDCESCDSTPPIPPVFPTPTPPTQTTPTPEPASLLLFGTGLAAFGAGLRRRYARRKKLTRVEASEDGGASQ